MQEMWSHHHASKQGCDTIFFFGGGGGCTQVLYVLKSTHELTNGTMVTQPVIQKYQNKQTEHKNHITVRPLSSV